MIEKDLAAITSADLELLVANKTHEGRALDYKRDLNLSKDEDKRELARDVSSFANATGGDLVFGIQEARDGDGKGLGYPEKIIGVPLENFDMTKQRIESIIRDNVDPRVPGISIHKIDGFERGPALLVRVPRSWGGPHMVSFANQTHFYSRNNSGKQPLDVREIRSLFIASAEVEQQVRRFRSDRLARIVAGETPVTMEPGAKLVIHVVPLGTGEARTLDVQALDASTNPMLMPVDYSNSTSSRFNLDGLLSYFPPGDGPTWSYSQAFRTGAFEGLDVVPLDGSKEPRGLYPLPVERSVVRAVEMYLRILRWQRVESPVVVFLALLGVRGARIYEHRGRDAPWRRSATIDHDPVLLPDVLLEGSTPDVPSLLRPMFDALWQASGWPRSFGYDDKGRWDPTVHGRG